MAGGCGVAEPSRHSLNFGSVTSELGSSHLPVPIWDPWSEPFTSEAVRGPSRVVEKTISYSNFRELRERLSAVVDLDEPEAQAHRHAGLRFVSGGEADVLSWLDQAR